MLGPSGEVEKGTPEAVACLEVVSKKFQETHEAAERSLQKNEAFGRQMRADFDRFVQLQDARDKAIGVSLQNVQNQVHSWSGRMGDMLMALERQNKGPVSSSSSFGQEKGGKASAGSAPGAGVGPRSDPLALAGPSHSSRGVLTPISSGMPLASFGERVPRDGMGSTMEKVRPPPLEVPHPSVPIQAEVAPRVHRPGDAPPAPSQNSSKPEGRRSRIVRQEKVPVGRGGQGALDIYSGTPASAQFAPPPSPKGGQWPV